LSEINSRQPAAYSVNCFCEDHHISRGTFYNMLKDGTGPRVMRVRGRTLISNEAACEWRLEREGR